MGFVKGTDGIPRTVRNPLEGSVGDIALNDVTVTTLSASTISATGNADITGNVTGGNVVSSALVRGVTVQASGNLVGGNANISTSVNTVTVNATTVSASNVTASGNISASGNVTAQNFIGNISITGNVTGTSSNVTLVAGSYSTVFDNTGVATFPGNVNVTGNVITPNLPAFRVYGNGTTNGLNFTTNGTGILNGNNWAVDYNQGSYLNSTTGVFTAPVAGLYQVNLNARCANNSAPTSQAIVYKNYGSANTVQVMWEVAANTTVNHFGVSTVSKLAVTDTLTLKVAIGNVNFDENDSWSVAFLG
jgi:hypothetical protein